MLIKPEYDIWKPAEHNGTFRGNQLAIVAAKAGIDYMLDHHVEDQVKEKEGVVRDFLEKEVLPLDSRLTARGKGLIWGVDCSGIPVKGFSGRVLENCFTRKMIIEDCGREGCVVKIMPPLVISKEDLLAGLEIIRDAFKEELAKL